MTFCSKVLFTMSRRPLKTCCAEIGRDRRPDKARQQLRMVRAHDVIDDLAGDLRKDDDGGRAAMAQNSVASASQGYRRRYARRARRYCSS